MRLLLIIILWFYAMSISDDLKQTNKELQKVKLEVYEVKITLRDRK